MSLVGLKEDLRLLERLYQRKFPTSSAPSADRPCTSSSLSSLPSLCCFRIISSNMDELVCELIDTDNKKYRIIANICENYPSLPPVWFSESEDAIIIDIIEKLSSTNKEDYRITNQVKILIMEFAKAKSMPHQDLTELSLHTSTNNTNSSSQSNDSGHVSTNTSDNELDAEMSDTATTTTTSTSSGTKRTAKSKDGDRSSSKQNKLGKQEEAAAAPAVEDEEEEEDDNDEEIEDLEDDEEEDDEKMEEKTRATAETTKGDATDENAPTSIDGISKDKWMVLEKVKSTQRQSHLKGVTFGSPMANDRLMKELRDIFRSENFKNHIYSVELVKDSLYEWNVELYKVDPDSNLYKDLQTFKTKEGKDHIMLNFTFKDNFPFEPPFVRVVYPVIKGGYVLSGGAICMELLTKQGWSSAYCIESVILQIAATLVKGQARIDFNSRSQTYSLSRAQCSFKSLTQMHEKNGWHTPDPKFG